MRDYARSRAWCEWAEFDNWAPLISAALADPDGDVAIPLPPAFHIERSQLTARVRGGTVLRRPMGAAEKGLLAALLLAEFDSLWNQV